MTLTLTEAPVVTLGYDEALFLLNRAVAERGADHVYDVPATPFEECVYFDIFGDPSCIVGHVLHYKGISAEDMREDNNNGIDLILAGAAKSEIEIRVDPLTRTLLTTVQESQDSQTPWGEALASAIHFVETGEIFVR